MHAVVSLSRSLASRTVSSVCCFSSSPNTATSTRRSLLSSSATTVFPSKRTNVARTFAIKTVRTTRPSPRHFSLLTLLCVLSSTTTSIPSVRAYSSFFGSSGSMSFNTERTGEGLITVSPKNEAEQSALVVISHGLGDTAEGFADVAEQLASKLPYIKFILPTAPVQPVTLNGGMRMNSWYDIVGLDEKSNEKCAGIQESRQLLMDILKKEHDNTNLPYSRMILAGFSQGAALSLFTGLQLPGGEAEKLAAVICMSGYLPAAGQFTITPGLEAVPVWHAHGTQDMVVMHSLAAKSKSMVETKGHNGEYILKSYPIGHTVSMEEISDLYQFLQKVLPDDATCKVTLKDPSEMSVKELKAAIRKAGLLTQAKGFTEKSEFIKLLQDFRSSSS